MYFNFKRLGFWMFFSFICFNSPNLIAQTLVHYWNFNDNTSLTTLLSPQTSLVAGASIAHIPGGSSTINVSGGTGQNFNVDNYNARNGDPSGSHLRFNDPIGGELEFALPTTGYENPIVQFTTRRSGSGAGLQTWFYTTDGVNYTAFTTVSPVDGNPELISFDFSDSVNVDNNPDFKIKVTFAVGTGGSGGNNRFDNFTLDAMPVGGVDITPPVPSFQPAHLTTGVSIQETPSVTFNEPVRLINDSPITNANASSVITLKLNDDNGPLVPFTVNYTGNTLTLTPTSSLLYNQQYYIAILPNTIEDYSDNAITTTAFAQFTTMPEQTIFNPGDIVPVAYRMNATATEDEIALLTFVDILPGTMIQLTDAKYTDNAQPQCAGGITWTAPSSACVAAGTVITIQTDALVTNLGTVSGNGFGLSSGGDQVIIYTGTPENPQYITALSSNAWLSANTSCSGNESKLPASLIDGVSSISLSTASGNSSGNSPNAYYNGPQLGTASQLKTDILDPSNWVVSGSGTAPQSWPSYSFPSSPTVTQALVTSLQTIMLVFNNDLDISSASNPANYTGISGLSTVNVTNNGTATDTVILSFASPFTIGSSYTLYVDNITNALGMTMACAYSWNFTYETKISLDKNLLVVDENIGNLDVIFNIENPSQSSFEIAVLGSPYSTADASDFTFATQTININGISNTHQIQIPIIDDTQEEQHAEYFNLVLRSPSGCSFDGDTLLTVYIRDNDKAAPAPTLSVELQYVGSFDPSGTNSSSCEVVAYDSLSRRLFVTNGVANYLDIIDFVNPLSPTLITSVNMNPYGTITSVSVYKGLVAVACPHIDPEQNGTVVFLDTQGNFLNQVTVGVLPDMIVFTPDGQKLLTANEGQPNADYSVDPEGSVSIIDVSGGVSSITQANVTTLDFTFFNGQEASLTAAGVRKTKASSTLSQDLEPEYITITPNAQTAWVTLQENNAIAEIDIQNQMITSIWPLGTKNMQINGNGFDASDKSEEILIANWPVKAFYIPDGIGNFQVGNNTFLVTANEGDEKEYDGFEERTTVGASSYVLDPQVFPHAEILKKSYNLGRFRVSNLQGDTDLDGDYDEIYAVGARSFSIFDASTQQLVYDSGDDFERYIASDPVYATIFNADNEDNEFKGRSRAKGPEPEGIAMASLSGHQYVFVALERVGGVMVYDVTDPTDVQFVDYKNTRSTAAYGGDNGAETAVFINAAQSADGKNYLVVANEVSGTLTIYEVVDHLVNAVFGASQSHTHTFNVFPNPVRKDGLLYLNRSADVSVLDMNGRLMYQGNDVKLIDISSYMPGMYLIQTSNGETRKFLVK